MNAGPILVKLSLDGYYLAISTYCRKRGRHGRFLIETQAVRDLLDGTIMQLNDMDLGSHVKICAWDGIARVCFDWLSVFSDGELRGFRQQFELPVSTLQTVIDTGEPVRYLYQEHEQQARIDTLLAGKNIRHILGSKIQRRAFVKAIRDNFHWRNTTVSMCPDGIDDFYFTNSDGCPANGGLIYQWGHVSTPIGMKSRYYYAVHT